MRLPALFAAVLLGGVTATGCGGASLHTGSASHAASPSTDAKGTSAGGGASAATLATKSTLSEHYLNDGDKEQEDAPDGDERVDTDHDPSLDFYASDHRFGENGRYHDGDDTGVLAYGRAASPGEAQAVAVAVERYYAALATDAGQRSCSMLSQSLAAGAAVDYGQAPGPSYLRGAKTCAAVMALLSKHYRRQLAAPSAVTVVRIVQGQTYAFVGSRTMPASVMIVQREGAAWKMAQLLGIENRLP